MSLMTFSCIICLMLDKTKATDINLSLESTFKPMERFWTNSGFSPMGNYSNFLQSKDTQLALELMSSLPNQGLNNVRIHWLLDSIETRYLD